MHVAEWLVERRKGDHVRGGVQPLHIPPRTGEADPVRDSQLPGQVLIRSRIALAGDHEPALWVAQPAHAPEERTKPPALESGPDEDNHPGLAPEPQGVA